MYLICNSVNDVTWTLSESFVSSDIEIGLCDSYAQGSSAADFWNLTRNGLYCHFGGYNKVTHNLSMEVTSNAHDTCRQVRLLYSTGCPRIT
jgi:hypothetical protein